MVYYILIIGVVAFLFFKKKKKLTPEQIEAQKKKALEEKVIQEKRAKEQLIKDQQRVKLKKEKEKKNLSDLLDSNERIYFSYSFVSNKSDLFLIDSTNNNILENSLTCAEKLYSQGFKIVDIDKTSQSAQLESFNFVIRFSRINKSNLKSGSKPTIKKRNLPPLPSIPPLPRTQK